MEIAATALMAIGSAASSAVAAVPAALGSIGSAIAPMMSATGAAGLAGAGSGMLSALQSGMTVASSISSILGGVGKYNEGMLKSRFADIEAEGERLRGEEQALRIKRELVQRIGDTRVAYAGSGLDVSSGYGVEGALGEQADFETSLARSGADMRRAGKLAQAAMARSQGTAGLLSGVVRGGGQLVDYGIDLAKRG